MLALAHEAGAQPLLSSVSHYSAATASATSGDYRYTRGGSPRTGLYWYWALRSDQNVGTAASAPLNGSTGNQTATGTFYKPTYFATSSASNTLSNTAAKSAYTVDLNTSTTLATPALNHQFVSLYAQTKDVTGFTLASAAYVRLVVKMADGGRVVFGNAVTGEALQASTGYSDSFQDLLPAGTYQVATYLYGTATQNAQTGILTNPGTLSGLLSYTLTATPTTGGGGTGGNGGGDWPANRARAGRPALTRARHNGTSGRGVGLSAGSTPGGLRVSRAEWPCRA